MKCCKKSMSVKRVLLCPDSIIDIEGIVVITVYRYIISYCILEYRQKKNKQFTMNCYDKHQRHCEQCRFFATFYRKLTMLSEEISLLSFSHLCSASSTREYTHDVNYCDSQAQSKFIQGLHGNPYSARSLFEVSVQAHDF